jgi:preprotein translocase subunit SecF
MFDIIGKRRYFYILSAVLTIPGLIFILISPFSDAGLQLTIDYTGGTRWEIKFEDPNVTPDQVEAVFAANDLDATAIRTGSGYIEIKTEPIGLAPAPAPTVVPTASPSASGSASPGVSESPSASGSLAPSAAPSGSAAPSVTPSASPGASASPDASASPGASASPSPSASAGPVGNTELPTDGRLGEMVVALEDQLGNIEAQASLTTIGAIVSSDLLRQALILIVVGSLGIVAWITYRFRDVKFGVTALASLGHDVVVVVGAFAILGTFFHVEIDALFVTAMLTVIGFSVVVFDRVRENKARHLGEPFDEIVNHSILQTFARSIMTSLTVLITLLALFLFGGAAINDFILCLLIGIVIGTYSSIFVASPLLVDWQRWDDRRHGRVASTRAPRARRATP